MQSSGEFSIKTIVWAFSGLFISILIGTNAFFIKSLVDKIDRIDGLQYRMTSLEEKMDLIINGLSARK